MSEIDGFVFLSVLITTYLLLNKNDFSFFYSGMLLMYVFNLLIEFRKKESEEK